MRDVLLGQQHPCRRVVHLPALRDPCCGRAAQLDLPQDVLRLYGRLVLHVQLRVRLYAASVHHP